VRLDAYFLTTGRRARTTTTVCDAALLRFDSGGTGAGLSFCLRCGGPSHSVAAGQRGNPHTRTSVEGFSVCWGHCLRMYVVIQALQLLGINICITSDHWWCHRPVLVRLVCWGHSLHICRCAPGIKIGSSTDGGAKHPKQLGRH
jgi:hypothetical protein